MSKIYRPVSINVLDIQYGVGMSRSQTFLLVHLILCLHVPSPTRRPHQESINRSVTGRLLVNTLYMYSNLFCLTKLIFFNEENVINVCISSYT